MTRPTPRAGAAFHAIADPRPRANHVMLGTTDSLCPECMQVVPAKIVTRSGRVYFRKRCPDHGVREDFVCSDVDWWDRGEGHTASVLPRLRSTKVSKGCPHDCGLCEEHEQHTCIGLVELTDRCNLTCPMCFADSSPQGKDHHHQFLRRLQLRRSATDEVLHPPCFAQRPRHSVLCLQHALSSRTLIASAASRLALVESK